MSNMLPAMPSVGKATSFWDRKEGTTGMLFLAGALGALVFFGEPVLGWFNRMLALGIHAVGQTLTLIALGSILAFVLAVATNPKFQALVSYGFKSFMRMLTSWFVEIDPIGIMKGYIEDLKGRLGLMDKRISDLKGQMKVCENKINERNNRINDALKQVDVANKKGVANVVTVQSRKAGMLKQSNMRFEDLLKQMTLIYNVLKKYREASDTVIQQLETEVEIRSEEREMILGAYSAMSAAKNIMNGGGDKHELFLQAMDFVVRDFGNKLGEIEDFMSSTDAFISGLDLQNGVFEEDALARIKEWEAGADSLVLGDTKQQLIENAQTGMSIPLSIQTMQTQPVGGSNYDHFLK